MARERLQKVLAASGVASRRRAEEIIRQGRVTVNGRVVVEMGFRVDPERDDVCVDGQKLTPERLAYILLHKPRGYVCTARDPQGRPTVLDLVRDAGARVYPVGRLDYDSSGLLLLTNDGPLSFALTHPRHRVEKTYRVRVAGRLSAATFDRLRQGVRLSDGMTAPARVRELSRVGDDSWLEIVLCEGRNRQVRRMLAAVGHQVKELVRVRVGDLTLGNLPPGAFRHLSEAEVARLLRPTRMAAPPAAGQPVGKPRARRIAARAPSRPARPRV